MSGVGTGMSKSSAKETVLTILHQLESDGYATPVVVSDGGVRRRVFWVIEDGRGGRGYFEQTETSLVRFTEEQFVQFTKM